MVIVKRKVLNLSVKFKKAVVVSNLENVVAGGCNLLFSLLDFIKVSGLTVGCQETIPITPLINLPKHNRKIGLPHLSK